MSNLTTKLKITTIIARKKLTWRTRAAHTRTATNPAHMVSWTLTCAAPLTKVTTTTIGMYTVKCTAMDMGICMAAALILILILIILVLTTMLTTILSALRTGKLPGPVA